MLIKILITIVVIALFFRVFGRIILLSILWLLGRAIKRQLDRELRKSQHRRIYISRRRRYRDDQGEYVDYEEVK